MIHILITISLVLSSLSAQNCSLSASLDQLSTGTYTFSLQPFTSRLQCFNVTLDSYYGSSKPQVAVGINGVSNFQSDSLGLDFSVRNLLSPSNTQLSLVLIVNNGSWGSVSVSYLITARPQFILGNGLSNGNILASCTKQQSYPLSFNLPSSQALPSSSSLGILILLSGLSTPSSLFSLQFTQPSLDIFLKQINTSVITNATKEIQLIEIYYVIVDLAKLSSNAYNYSFSLTPLLSDFSISGIVAINTQSLQHAFFAINRTAKLSCVGFSCSACQTSTSCVGLGGQVFGFQCVKCDSNQVFVNGACACSQGFNLINGTCQSCPSGTLFSSLLNKCSSICTTNQIWINGSCQCVTGFSLINGQCQQLKCGSGLFNYKGTCYPCPTNSTPTADQTQCVCLPGYYYVNTSANSSACLLPVPTNYSSASNSASSSSYGTFSSSTGSGTGVYTLPTTNPSSTSNTTGSTSTIYASGSSTNSSSSGTSTTSTNSTTSTTSSGTGSATGFLYGGAIITNPTVSNCPTGAYYKNLTCRSQATISIFQTAQINGQSVVYVGIIANNLPDTLPNNSSPNLILAKLINSPQNTSVSINISSFNPNQWIANINYTNYSAPLTLVLSFNPIYSFSFTSVELIYSVNTVIIPSQVTVYNIAITPTPVPTNSLTIEGDTLTNESSQAIAQIFNKQ